MSSDMPPKTSNKHYVWVAIAAVFFLLVLPGFVLAIASDMTGIKLISVGDEKPLVQHEFLERRNIGPSVAYWILIEDGTPADEMKRIVLNIVKTKYRGQPRITVYFFRGPDPITNLPKKSATHESDDTFVWTLSGGIRKIL